MESSVHFAEGRLADALAAQTEHVKKTPLDVDGRGLLADLLCFAGDLERADLQLAALEKQVPEAAPTIALRRQLVRAEVWRQESITAGRVPDFLGAPSEGLSLHLKALVELREGREGEAADLLAQAEELRPKLAWKHAGQSVSDVRDADDTTAGFLEVLTSTGKLLWVPLERILNLEPHAPERARDLLWRRASLRIEDGPEGEVFLATIYAPTPKGEAARLGRATDWTESDPIRGTGQRTLLVGDEAIPMLELGTLEREVSAP